MARKVTNELLDLIGEGVLSPEEVIIACLKYMSEDEVADMAHINGFIEDNVSNDTEDEE